MSAEDQKKNAGEAALKVVTNGVKIGLGTGSTANYFIKAAAAKVKQEDGCKLSCVIRRLLDHGERILWRRVQISSLSRRFKLVDSLIYFVNAGLKNGV